MLAQIIERTQSLLPLTVLLSGFVGSWHCVGMCGGWVAAVADQPRKMMLYQLGRLLGYLSLGGIAGWGGSFLFESAYLRNFQMAALGIAEVVIIWMMIDTFRQSPKHRSLSQSLNLGTKVLKYIYTRAPFLRTAFFAGLLTSALPCGWLYTFVAASAMTRDFTRGALLLALFWLGNLPALVCSRTLFATVLRPIGRRSQALVGFIILSLAFLNLSLKGYNLFRNSDRAGAVPSCPFHPQ